MQAGADVVEEHRTHLLQVAYRLTGSLADAEDAVQKAGRVSCFAIRDGQVAAIYDMVNPDKIGRAVGP